MGINETQTKKLLGLIYDNYQRNNRICYSTIYDFLGISKEEGGAYTATPMKSSDLLTGMQRPIMQSTWQEMPEGLIVNFEDYFHKVLEAEIVPDYRIILNIKSQQKALELAASIISKPLKGIYSLKIYATDMNLTELKYDKMVIYYNSSVLSHEVMIDFLNKLLTPVDLNPNISGFYQEVKPGMGIGKELGYSSFTTERAYDVMEFLINCGGKYIRRDELDFVYGALNTEITERAAFISQLYDYVVRRIKQQEEGLL